MISTWEVWQEEKLEKKKLEKKKEERKVVVEEGAWTSPVDVKICEQHGQKINMHTKQLYIKLSNVPPSVYK